MTGPDRVNVAITGDASGLEEAMQRAASSTANMQRRVTSSLKDVEESSVHLSHGALVGVGELTRGFSNMAVAGEAGSFALRELSGGAARLGMALGPAGGLAGIAVIAAGAIYQLFEKSREEIKKTREAFEGELKAMANAGEFVKLNEKAREIWVGTPFDSKGKLNNFSQVTNSFKGSLKDMESDLAFLQRQMRKTGFLTDDIADLAIKKKIDDLMPRLNAARAEFQRIQTVIAIMQDNRANGEMLPSISTAKRDPTQKEREKELADYVKAQQEAAEKYSKLWADHFDGVYKYERDVSEARRKLEEKNVADQKKQFEELWENTKKTIADAQKQIADEYDRWAERTERGWMNLFNSITDSWNRTVNLMREGHDKISNFWRDLFHDMVRTSIEGFIKMEEARAAHWLRVNAMDAVGTAKSVALVIASVLKKVAAYAIEAAAAAWASISAIPFVGPFLAPAVAAAALVGVLSLAGGLGGGSSGKPSGGGGGTTAASSASAAPSSTVIHIHAMDAASFHAFAMKNSDTFARAAVAGASNGFRLPTSPGRGS